MPLHVPHVQAMAVQASRARQQQRHCQVLPQRQLKQHSVQQAATSVLPREGQGPGRWAMRLRLMRMHPSAHAQHAHHSRPRHHSGQRQAARHGQPRQSHSPSREARCVHLQHAKSGVRSSQLHQ